MAANGGGYRAEDEYDYLFKVVLIGDSGVSKSNLCPAAARQHPAPSHRALLQRTHPPSALTTSRPHWSTGRRPKVRSPSPSSRLASVISSSPSPPAKESSSSGDVSPICLWVSLHEPDLSSALFMEQ